MKWVLSVYVTSHYTIDVNTISVIDGVIVIIIITMLIIMAMSYIHIHN